MSKRTLTAVLLLPLLLSAVLLPAFLGPWQQGQHWLAGAPWASQSFWPEQHWLIDGLLLDVLLWSLLALAGAALITNYWQWTARWRRLGLLGYIAAALTAYSTRLGPLEVTSGWPLEAWSSAGLSWSALAANGLVLLLLTASAYWLLAALRRGPGHWPPVTTILIVAPLATALTVALGLLLPSAVTNGWELAVSEQLLVSSGHGRQLGAAVTILSSPGANLCLALLVLAAYYDRRRWLAYWPLLASILLVLTVPELKELFARPRPETSGNLTDYALPAGHAAGSVIYLVLALYLLPPTVGRWLLLAAAALTISLGLLRVILGFHWLGDIFAGWSWGLAVYAFSAGVLLAARQVSRHWPPGQRPVRESAAARARPS